MIAITILLHHDYIHNMYCAIHAGWCYTMSSNNYVQSKNTSSNELKDILQNFFEYDLWLTLCYVLLFVFYATLYCSMRCPVSRNSNYRDNYLHFLGFFLVICILFECTDLYAKLVQGRQFIMFGNIMCITNVCEYKNFAL